MARDVIASPIDGSASRGSAVEDYLAELSAHLDGSHRVRARILTETLDGLHECIAAHTASGLPHTQAEQVAVTEFGPPATVAAAFESELATVQARRTLCAFVLTGPLVGIWWLLLLAPRPLSLNPAALWAAVPVLPLLAVAVAATILILATTGSLIRWFPEPSLRLALLAAAAVGLSAIAADATVLAVLVVRSVSGSWQFHPALAATAVGASLLRLAFAWQSIRSSLRTRRRVRPRPRHPSLPRA